MDEFVLVCDKPGIVSILGCGGPGTAKVSSSLRRTLSADMSSRKWMEQNGFCPMKKAKEDSSSSDNEVDILKKDVEGCGGRVYLWKSVKESGKDAGSEEPGVRNKTWGSILFQKVEDSKSLPPPYTHPLVKRSKSTLSMQSLEICTESLGSETGSVGFSSYPASEVGDMEAEDRLLSQAASFEVEEFYEVEYVPLAARKTKPQSFPPPIQSLSQGNGGGSLSIHSRRNNGRLVLEAVSIPSEKNFEARREAGRLVLTFAANDQTCHKDEEEIDEEEDDELVMEMDEDILEEMEIGTVEFTLESIQELSSGGMINVATILDKTAASLNRDPARKGKYNELFDYEVDEEQKPILPEQVLLTLSTVTASASLNAYDYEYFWRKKSSATISIVSTKKAHSSSHNINESWESRLLRRWDGYSAPSPQGCNSPSRRSNLLWEPKCIATS